VTAAIERPTIDIPAHLVARDAAVAFEVVGDYMTPGIRDGDYVLVDLFQPVSDGAIGVVWIRTAASKGLVVKHVHREPGALRLESANPAYPPKVVTNAVIMGRVIARHRFTGQAVPCGEYWSPCRGAPSALHTERRRHDR
jgi:phage repressor protein C with HTH and peptisase S24 domain